MEVIIAMAVVSIFTAYFMMYMNNIEINRKSGDESYKLLLEAKEIIEKSSSNGNLFKKENNEDYMYEYTKIIETERRIVYELKITDKNTNKVVNYEFTIDKKQKK